MPLLHAYQCRAALFPNYYYAIVYVDLPLQALHWDET